MHPIRARHGHLVAVLPKPAPAQHDQSRDTDISVATGQLHASTEAFSLALEAACSAASHIERATARGAGSSVDLGRVERHEAKLHETFRLFEAALAHLRRKHHGVEA